MKTSSAYAAYSHNNVSIESPEKLIEMLYEGILRFTAQAKVAMDAQNIEKKTYWINRSIAIFSELLNTINFDQGDVSYYLNGLYTREIQLLVEANIRNEQEPLDEVIHVTRQLLEAWRETTKIENVE